MMWVTSQKWVAGVFSSCLGQLCIPIKPYNKLQQTIYLCISHHSKMNMLNFLLLTSKVVRKLTCHLV